MILALALGPGTGGCKRQPEPAPPGNKPPSGAAPSTGVTDPPFADLIARWDELHSVFAAVKTELPQEAFGNPGYTNGKGTYEYLRKSGRTLIRFELVNHASIDKEVGKRLSTGEVLLSIVDGEFLYSQLQQHKLKTATKSRYKPDAVLQIGGRDLLKGILDGNDVKLLPEETLGGKSVCVLEAKPKKGLWTTRHYFDKQTGIRLKLVETNDKAETVLAIELSDVRINPELGDDRFTYSAPEGFDFKDTTGEQP